MLKLTILLSVLFLSLVKPSAHEIELPPSPYIKASKQYHELFEHLDHILEESRLYGATVSDAEQIKFVEKLIEVVHTQIQDAAKELGEPSAGEKIWHSLKINIFPHFNYIKIFKFIKNTARKVGPKFAVAMATTEILENSLYLLTAMNPENAYLLPLSWFHAIDIVVYGAFFGVPEVITKLKTYSRFGGFVSGMHKYYQHLVAQKEILPIDWTEAIDLEKLNLRSKENTEVRIDLVILKNAFIERLLPNKLQKIIFPRRVAQRETSVAVSVKDLEKLAKKLDIPIYMYEGAHQRPPLYSNFLLKDILSHANGNNALIDYFENRGYKKFFDKPLIESPVLASNIIGAESVQALTWEGERPDILAQRLIWYFEDQIERVREAGETTKIDFKHLRQISRTVQKDLRRIAETHYGDANYQSMDNPKDFEELFKYKTQIIEELEKFESTPHMCRLLFKKVTAK